jgi:tetratricopeptide (TPR) repeat protein
VRNATEKACALHEAAIALRAQGEPAKARRAALRAAGLFEAEDGPGSPDVANALLVLAGANHDLADYRVALAHAERALAILERVPARDLDVVRMLAQALQSVGNELITLGDFRAARPHLIRAVRLTQKHLPEGELAGPLNLLGILGKYQARYDEAARAYGRVISILRKQRASALALSTVYHNMAGLEHARGRFDRAIGPARKGLAMRRRALGANHVDVAADVAALAAILSGAGQRREAERLYKRALRVFERKLGRGHFEVALNLGNLAALYQQEGRHAEAARLYARAIRLKRRLLGPRHPDLALTLANFAVLRRAEGKRALALALFRDALAMYEKTVGRSHPETRRCASQCKKLRSEAART